MIRPIDDARWHSDCQNTSRSSRKSQFMDKRANLGFLEPQSDNMKDEKRR
jgi:hypothetical protein